MNFENLFGTFAFKDSKQETIFKAMFDGYMNDLPANFYRNQFDLATQYPGTSYENWVTFLKHPAFNSWKNEQIGIIAGTETDKALVSGLKDKDSLNLLKARKDVLESENNVQKPTIIVIPDSLFFKDK